MTLTFMFEQPPTAEPIKHTMTTTERGWMTVLDEHGVPLLRVWIEPDNNVPTIGLGVYGALGDYVLTIDLEQNLPGRTWEARFPRWE